MSQKNSNSLVMHERITIDPEQCGGQQCIRGMRIRVSDVLDLFAARKFIHPVLAAA